MYLYLRLFRLIDADRRTIELELTKLAEFIKHRSSCNKDLSYYTLTYVRKGSIDGFVIVESEDEEALAREVELIRGFIESNLSTIRATVVKSRSDGYLNLPLPRGGNF